MDSYIFVDNNHTNNICIIIVVVVEVKCKWKAGLMVLHLHFFNVDHFPLDS